MCVLCKALGQTQQAKQAIETAKTQNIKNAKYLEKKSRAYGTAFHSGSKAVTCDGAAVETAGAAPHQQVAACCRISHQTKVGS